MKLRAPRCSDAVFLMSVPASLRAIPSSSAAARPDQRSAAVINTKRLSMLCDPFRHRLHAVEFRVPGHRQEENKIQNRADFGQGRVDARRRPEAAVSPGYE